MENINFLLEFEAQLKTGIRSRFHKTFPQFRLQTMVDSWSGSYSPWKNLNDLHSAQKHKLPRSLEMTVLAAKVIQFEKERDFEVFQLLFIFHVCTHPMWVSSKPTEILVSNLALYLDEHTYTKDASLSSYRFVVLSTPRDAALGLSNALANDLIFVLWFTAPVWKCNVHCPKRKYRLGVKRSEYVAKKSFEFRSQIWHSSHRCLPWMWKGFVACNLDIDYFSSYLWYHDLE